MNVSLSFLNTDILKLLEVDEWFQKQTISGTQLES